VRLDVLADMGLDLNPGECLALDGPSGTGKSTLLRTLWGNYGADGGRIMVRHQGQMIDLATADPRLVLEARRRTIGYVSQFLRVIPRVPTLDVVAEPMAAQGNSLAKARERAADLLTQLDLPSRLWSLPPQTFSGGEQQRVNIARGFAGKHRLLILDEPTASLDAVNREAVIGLIAERKAQGTAFLGIFHDAEVRERVADRILDVTRFSPAREFAA
jgi:alpha-D-ribose 1-methylphosphonate 5-triphosphate synthase subunit PhnL